METYHKKQLEIIRNLRGATIQIKTSAGKTSWMNLNVESAEALLEQVKSIRNLPKEPAYYMTVLANDNVTSWHSCESTNADKACDEAYTRFQDIEPQGECCGEIAVGVRNSTHIEALFVFDLDESTSNGWRTI
jgi:hypothetical protein